MLGNRRNASGREAPQILLRQDRQIDGRRNGINIHSATLRGYLFHCTVAQNFWVKCVKLYWQYHFCAASHTTTDIFFAFVRRYKKISIRNALSFFEQRERIHICGYEIWENSKHSRCPYTRQKWAFRLCSLCAHFILLGFPKPSLSDFENTLWTLWKTSWFYSLIGL